MQHNFRQHVGELGGGKFSTRGTALSLFPLWSRHCIAQCLPPLNTPLMMTAVNELTLLSVRAHHERNY